MRTFWFVIYNTAGVTVLWLIFRTYSLFNSKVREGFKKRRDLSERLDKSLSSLDGRKRILIHSSSLGEYQQAIPLMEELLKNNFNIVLSFFSPSGYNNSNITTGRVVKTYLPFDSIGSEKKFIEKINPETVILMRYDLWYNLLYQAKKKNILTILSNARYDDKDSTWKIPLISSFKKTLYGMIDTIFVIDEFDEINYKKKLNQTGIEIIRTGDSKFERVYQSVKMESHAPVLSENVMAGRKIFVIGSSWKEDEDIVLPAADKASKYDGRLLTILVPHEPKETKISAIEKTIKSRYKNLKSIRYSEIGKYKNENLIIVDRIGVLSKLYSSAYLSYVGGGFRTGLHNILEPAIFNMPIFFSNKVKNSDEDEILLNHGCGILVEDMKQFYKTFRSFLKDERLRNDTGEKCKLVFKNSQGVAKKIVDYVIEKTKN